MYIFPNKKSCIATAFMPSLFLALLFANGCTNNGKTTANPSEADKVELTPMEQAEADKYVREYGSKYAIMYYFQDDWKKLEKKLDEAANTEAYEEIEDDSEAWFGEAKKLAHIDDRRILNYTKFFVAQGADVSPPLLGAVILGSFETVQFLVSKGADVNPRANDGFSPLTWASMYGQDKIVRFLVSKGADVNARDGYGQTPLRLAVVNENFRTVKFLVSKGADVNAKDNEGHTPLYWASHPEITEFLISKGAK